MCGTEIHRENIRTATLDEYYRQTITIQLLDHLLMVLTSRFNEHARKATMGLLFHMTQPISRSTIKAIACSKPTISEH